MPYVEYFLGMHDMDFFSKLPASHGRYDKLTDTVISLYFKKKTITFVVIVYAHLRMIMAKV